MTDQPRPAPPETAVSGQAGLDLHQHGSFTQSFPPQQHAPGAVLSQQTVQLWQSQFMPPDAVERLERLHPGTWNRMLTMAEQAQAGQIENTRQINANVAAETKRGQWLGWTATLVAMILGCLCAWIDHPNVAGILLSVPVTAVIKSLVEASSRVRSEPSK